ncbi:MAG: hypothetical protein ABSG95_09450 [Solirubrobacteraceae bacterium]
MRGLKLGFGVGGLCADALLLLVEEVEGDRVLVVGVQELRALVGQLGEPALLAGCLLFGLGAHLGEGVVEL